MSDSLAFKKLLSWKQNSIINNVQNSALNKFNWQHDKKSKGTIYQHYYKQTHQGLL